MQLHRLSRHRRGRHPAGRGQVDGTTAVVLEVRNAERTGLPPEAVVAGEGEPRLLSVGRGGRSLRCGDFDPPSVVVKGKISAGQ
ncbi:hypothetical protein [Kitasatospora phosalacinea]|uniref:Uncharacterized protein n=1 Tax=Kitasatospora phosalacinea TaxID=2065 RepID=A0A9W6UNF6_9ACTN|nr:hypothetical protein [Kitasatospora phosalacinea]GLW54102.1 hypothetical protein Kpho01_21130 [Kitasatospora phosalacinea]